MSGSREDSEHAQDFITPQVETRRTLKLAPAWQEPDRNLPCVLEALYPRLDLLPPIPHPYFSNVLSYFKGGLEKVPDGQ